MQLLLPHDARKATATLTLLHLQSEFRWLAPLTSQWLVHSRCSTLLSNISPSLLKWLKCRFVHKVPRKGCHNSHHCCENGDAWASQWAMRDESEAWLPKGLRLALRWFLSCSPVPHLGGGLLGPVFAGPPRTMVVLVPFRPESSVDWEKETTMLLSLSGWGPEPLCFRRAVSGSKCSMPVFEGGANSLYFIHPVLWVKMCLGKIGLGCT